ncbi:MAG: ABC transporter ATP-binding protein [Desulfocapsaceae bacterium]|jgi:putative hydroxymethylpyrimidine transport system ATP-binding protein|nr:ABC transporter ATP-binding protein [Desulfocapsaceae bacterium]
MATDTDQPPGTVMPSVFIDELSLSFHGDIIFDHLSLQIEGGKCTCILGPSGCGKSTLLRLISGNRSIDHQGIISIAPGPAGANLTAWMSQNDLLLPWMSVEDNVLLGAKLRFEISAALRQKAVQLLEKAGLGSYRTSLPSSLSGGMRQRVALLRTLMENRPVLLMDEPFSALDALTRIRLQDLAARLIKGKTVLLVTHDPLEALRLGDTILVLAGSPTRVAARFDMDGTPPREADGGIMHEQYPQLLKTLMEH